MLGRAFGIAGGLPGNYALTWTAQHFAMEARSSIVHVNSGFLTCGILLRPLSVLAAAVRTFGLDTMLWETPSALQFSQS